MTRGSLPVTVVPANFVSLVSPIPGNAEGSTYYESLGYDSLVPNINFAKLLNIQGEMEVKDRIVKFIVDLFTQKHTTLVSGEVYVCAFLGNEWRGMKIVKSANK